jgi:endonuclease/exonuclease/phosphatase family metal-dependent hydrolase
LSLRVVTFNLRVGNDQDPAIGHWLADVDPDIAILTECRGERGTAIATLARRNVRTAAGLCLLSRLKIDSMAARDPREFWKDYGSGAIVRATVHHPIAGPLRIGMVHLATPRHVLDHFFDLSSIPTLGDTVDANIALRDRESAAAREWIGDPSDVDLIAGDFNLPVESAIYRRHWGDYANAFWDAGWGLGRTKHTRLIGVRIDHILLGDRLHARRTWVGPALGSDHRPVIAEVRIRD